MDPHKRFCHNEHCWAYGGAREAHIVIHGKKSTATAANGALRPFRPPRTLRSTGCTSPTPSSRPS